MSSSDHTNQISTEDVRHVAELARLALDNQSIEACRSDLGSILGHIETINSIPTDGVEPMAHAIDMTNRLSQDEAQPSLPIEDVLANAPAVEDRYIAVPKVLDEDGNN